MDLLLVQYSKSYASARHQKSCWTKFQIYISILIL